MKRLILSVIVLSGSYFLFNCKNSKQMADSQADMQVGRTPGAPLQENYWKLVELNGQLIGSTAEGQREAHLKFRKAGNVVEGSISCNTLRGTYEMKDGNRLSLSPLAVTRKFCANNKPEGRFLKVLEKADSYAISGDTLFLHRARMAPLARLEAVYF